MSDHSKEPGRARLTTGARPAGRADPLDAAGRLRRPWAPDGAGCRGGDQGSPHAVSYTHLRAHETSAHL
eukprot:6462686-Alexandrium_andersonii.AAC.1